MIWFEIVTTVPIYVKDVSTNVASVMLINSKLFYLSIT